LGAQKEPQGTFRIGVTPFFGKAHLVPAVLAFLERYPKVHIDLSLNISEHSFHESGMDMLVRAGNIQGRSIARAELAPIRHAICATPGYLEAHGVPKTPKDLMNHNCLLSTFPNPMSEWPFVKGRHRAYVPVSGNFRSDSVEALYQAVMNGTGIARLSDYVIAPELRSGKLRSLFPTHDNTAGYGTTTNTMKAYYLKSRFPNPIIQAFIQFLKVRFKSNYNWEHRDARVG
jgi:DNA-binding transcriptional LysR family regulator